ncbi:MAG: hypothetical protein NT053_13075, partial [Cyanobacteria bacterium]|nr:hypothetical protein [Cyanobacteriota bacterium]
MQVFPIHNNEFGFNSETENILNLALTSAYSRLAAVSSNNFSATLFSVFGENADLCQFQALAGAWSIGDFGQLPSIQNFPGSLMNGANGAFSESNHAIYLSSDYLSLASHDIDAVTGITRTLLEEVGHFVDSLVNPGSDTPGDEGELFAASLMGVSLSPQDQDRIAQENDHSFLNVNGRIAPVELFLPDSTVVESAGSVQLLKKSSNRSYSAWGTAAGSQAVPITNGGVQIYEGIYGSDWQLLAAETVNGV